MVTPTMASKLSAGIRLVSTTPVRNMLMIRMPGARRLMTQVPGGQYHLVVACGHHLAKLRELATKGGIEVFTA